MRARHTVHALSSFPVYSCAFLAPQELILGGGGGASKSGIKNRLRLYIVKDDRSIELQDEFELEKGEDAPMSMAAHAESSTFVCGVNSVLEKLEKGENENCRVFSVKEAKIQSTCTIGTLTNGDIDDYQKVTVLSPDGSLVAVAGSYSLALFSYPDMKAVTEPIHTSKEIYDATFSSKSLVVATTHNLMVYALPETLQSETKGKNKSANAPSEKLASLKLTETIGLPSSTGEGSTFRAVRYQAQNEESLYAVVNTSTPRSKKAKGPSRQAFICRYNAQTWAVEKTRKVGDRGITCFDISPDGRFLSFGSSDLVIGMLDSKTLSPLVTILKAHEFPPTTLKFNPSSTLLVSGSADNSIRVIGVPSPVDSAPWTWTMIILLIIGILLGLAAQQYLGSHSLKW